MIPALWAGPMCLAAFLGLMSYRARRHWVALYLLALFFGSSTGLVLWSWPDAFRTVYWIALVVYAIWLPLDRTSRTLQSFDGVEDFHEGRRR